MAPKPARRSFKQHRKQLGQWLTKRIKLLGSPEEEERCVSTTPDMPDVPCTGLGPGPLDAHNPRKHAKLSYQALEAARRTPVSDIVEGDQTDALRRSTSAITSPPQAPQLQQFRQQLEQHVADVWQFAAAGSPAGAALQRVLGPLPPPPPAPSSSLEMLGPSSASASGTRAGEGTSAAGGRLGGVPLGVLVSGVVSSHTAALLELGRLAAELAATQEDLRGARLLTDRAHALAETRQEDLAAAQAQQAALAAALDQLQASRLVSAARITVPPRRPSPSPSPAPQAPLPAAGRHGHRTQHGLQASLSEPLLPGPNPRHQVLQVARPGVTGVSMEDASVVFEQEVAATRRRGQQVTPGAGAAVGVAAGHAAAAPPPPPAHERSGRCAITRAAQAAAQQQQQQQQQVDHPQLSQLPAASAAAGGCRAAGQGSPADGQQQQRLRRLLGGDRTPSASGSSLGGLEQSGPAAAAPRADTTGAGGQQGLQLHLQQQQQQQHGHHQQQPSGLGPDNSAASLASTTSSSSSAPPSAARTGPGVGRYRALMGAGAEELPAVTSTASLEGVMVVGGGEGAAAGPAGEALVGAGGCSRSSSRGAEHHSVVRNLDAALQQQQEGEEGVGHGVVLVSRGLVRAAGGAAAAGGGENKLGIAGAVMGSLVAGDGTDSDWSELSEEEAEEGVTAGGGGWTCCPGLEMLQAAAEEQQQEEEGGSEEARASSGGSSPRACASPQQPGGQQRGGFGSTFVPAATSISADTSQGAWARPAGVSCDPGAASSGQEVGGLGRVAIELQLQGAGPAVSGEGAASLSCSGAPLGALPGVGPALDATTYSSSSDGDDSALSDSEDDLPPRGPTATGPGAPASGRLQPKHRPGRQGSALAAALGLSRHPAAGTSQDGGASSTSSWPVLAPGSMGHLAGLAAAAEGQAGAPGNSTRAGEEGGMAGPLGAAMAASHAPSSSGRKRWGEANGATAMTSNLQHTQQQVQGGPGVPPTHGSSSNQEGLEAAGGSSMCDRGGLGPSALTASSSSCVSITTLGTCVTSSSLAGMDLLPQLTSRTTLGGGEGRVTPAAASGGAVGEQAGPGCASQQQRPPQVPRLAMEQVLGGASSSCGQPQAMSQQQQQHRPQQQQQQQQHHQDGSRPSSRAMPQQQQTPGAHVAGPSSVASSSAGRGLCGEPHRQSNNSTTSSGRGGMGYPGTHQQQQHHQQQHQQQGQVSTAPSSGAATPRGGAPGTTWGSSRSSTGLGSAPGFSSARSLRPEGSAATTSGAAPRHPATHQPQQPQQQERPLTGGSTRSRLGTPRSILVLTPRPPVAEDSLGLGGPVASRPPSLTPRAVGAGYMASRPAHLYASTSTAYAMYSPLSRGLGALGPRGGPGDGAPSTSSSSLAPPHPHQQQQAAAGGLGRPSSAGLQHPAVGQVPSSWSVDVPPSPGLLQQQGGQRGAPVNSSLTRSTNQGLQRGRPEVMGLAPTGVMPPPAAAARAAAAAADTVEAVVQLVMGGGSGRLLPAPASLTPRRAAALAATAVRPGSSSTSTGAQLQRPEVAARSAWAAPQQQQQVAGVVGVGVRRETAAVGYQQLNSSSPQRRPRGDWQHPVVLEGEASRGGLRGAGSGSAAAAGGLGSPASGWVGGSSVSRGGAVVGMRSSGGWGGTATSPGSSWQHREGMMVAGGAAHLATSRPSSRGSWCGGSVASASTAGAGGSLRCRVGGSGVGAWSGQGGAAASGGGAGSPSRCGRGPGVHWNPLYDPAALMVLPGSAAGELVE